MIHSFLVTAVILLSTLTAHSSEILLTAKQTSYGALVTNQADLKKYLFAILDADQTGKLSIPLTLTEAEIAAVEKSCYSQGRLVLLEKCLTGLSPENTQTIMTALINNFDRFAPSYTLTFDPAVNSLLNKEPYVQFLHGSIDFQGRPTDAKAILPKPVADVLWTSTLKMYEANCLGTSISAVQKNMTPSFIWPPADYMNKYFQQIHEDETLQIGDVFAFIIPGDGHFFTYIGTDAATGEKMVLSKNGSSPSPFQFMRYQDVNKIYKKYATGTARYRSVDLIKDDLLYLKSDVTNLTWSMGSSDLDNLFQKFLMENM